MTNTATVSDEADSIHQQVSCAKVKTRTLMGVGIIPTPAALAEGAHPIFNGSSLCMTCGVCPRAFGAMT